MFYSTFDILNDGIVKQATLPYNNEQYIAARSYMALCIKEGQRMELWHQLACQKAISELISISNVKAL